jgi:diguanylate cyclase (GGDEF)-like protein/PAS domain S-box-containing protein
LQRRSDELSQESKERRQLFETSLDLILITDKRGNYLRVSPSALETVGYRPEEMLGHSGAEFIYSDDLEKTRAEMRLARRGSITRNFECRYVHKDGRVIPLSWSGVWSEPEQKHYFIGRDITERKQAEERLWQLAHVDSLTGLPNGASFRDDLTRLLGGDNQGNAAVAMIDVDGFGEINNTFGRQVGDELLRQIAGRLKAVAGPASVYRTGGDDFSLMIEKCADGQVIADAAERALGQLAVRFEADGQSLFVHASAGIACAPGDATDSEALIANAGLALHNAKADGGGAWRRYVPEMRARAKARRALEAELRRACANGEFLLYFQPQLRSGDGTVAGAEALLRWRHPEKDILPPGVFIDALSDSAMSLELGRWILKSACAAAAEWRRKQLGEVRVAVNLFPAHFYSPTLADDVEDALARSGLPPSALELEITENIALSSDTAAIAPLRALRAKGVGIAFDDFGTGYASLSYLTRYPISRIKIDRSFVQRISAKAKPEETAIVRSIVAMASNLGLQVTAEGVETTDQCAFLRSAGCDELQGFLFSKPLSKRSFERYLFNNGSSAIARSPRRAALN